MALERLSDINIDAFKVLATPDELRAELPLSPKAHDNIRRGREEIKAILDKKDNRLVVVVGPCSIHDINSAKEYGEKLHKLAQRVNDQLLIVMRSYFEKPRTTVGWKGFLNDPHLNDTFCVEEGIRMGRKLLIELSEIGLPLGTEALDPISPQYLQDTISWSAVGARTTESQTHREMASGLSVPVGFKNGTDGGMQVAINAMKSAMRPHHFLGINQKGQVSIIATKGNPYCHIVLRGGSSGPNYDSVHISMAEEQLRQSGLALNIMVDCSHANSNKDYNLQPLVLRDVGHQIRDKNNSITGVMIESHLFDGSQSIPKDKKDLKYGVSITDACIGWEKTEKAMLDLAKELKTSLPNRGK
jgi:3-deoxy-7-phosphoheptulonate synthase